MSKRKVLLCTLISIFFFSSSKAKDKLNLSLALLSQSQAVYRGVQLWPAPSFMPGIGLTFYEQISLQGPHLFFHPFSRKSSHDLKTGLRLFDDNSPLISVDRHDNTYRNQRESSLDFYLSYRWKFGFRNSFFVQGLVSQEISSHNGLYGELSLGVPVYKFTELELKGGFHDNHSSDYLFGDEAKSGLGHVEVNINHVNPRLPWRGVWINSLSHSWITEAQNRSRNFVRGRHNLVTFQSTLIWKFY